MKEGTWVIIKCQPAKDPTKDFERVLTGNGAHARITRVLDDKTIFAKVRYPMGNWREIGPIPNGMYTLNEDKFNTDLSERIYQKEIK